MNMATQPLAHTAITPRAAGFRMPAEWEPHAGCWMAWPERPDTWRLGAKPAQAAFARLANTIARYEPVTMLASARQWANATRQLDPAVRVVEMSTDDAWLRDTGSTFVIDRDGNLGGVDWQFNGWGGLSGGLYFPWDADDGVAAKMLGLERARHFRAPLVCEGGAIHVDGQGTVITTEACLLNPNRNPGSARDDVEAMLGDLLGIDTVIWLHDGVPDDITGGHVDNLACFVAPGVVLLSWCDDPADPHHAVSREAEARLLAARDSKGRPIRVERIPMPTPMFLTAEEASGIDRTNPKLSSAPGDRLAASYVNFLIVNGAVIAPAFGVPTDAAAEAILKGLFPTHEIVMLPSREILLGGGNIHCVTQQQPAVARG
jgi:agmatine deiminase